MPQSVEDERVHGTLDRKLQADYWEVAKDQKIHAKSHHQCDPGTCDVVKRLEKRLHELDLRAAKKPKPVLAEEGQLRAIKHADEVNKKIREKSLAINSALGKIGMGEKYSAAQREAQKRARVVRTEGGKQALELRREDEQVTFIPEPLPGKPMTLDHLNVETYDALYRPMDGNPVEKVAKLFAGFALDLGATPQAVEELSALINIPDKEKEIAMAKNSAALSKTNGKTNGKTATTTKGKTTSKGKHLRVAHEGERESAASLFRKLIMAGGQSDDAIFAAVKKKFNLDDKKRSYVAWYRNDLRKNGQKPPEPVKAKK